MPATKVQSKDLAQLATGEHFHRGGPESRNLPIKEMCVCVVNEQINNKREWDNEHYLYKCGKVVKSVTHARRGVSKVKFRILQGKWEKNKHAVKVEGDTHKVDSTETSNKCIQFLHSVLDSFLAFILSTFRFQNWLPACCFFMAHNKYKSTIEAAATKASSRTKGLPAKIFAHARKKINRK